MNILEANKRLALRLREERHHRFLMFQAIGAEIDEFGKQIDHLESLIALFEADAEKIPDEPRVTNDLSSSS